MNMSSGTKNVSAKVFFQLINEMFLFLLHWKIELLMVLGSLDEHQRHYGLSSSRTLNINIMEKPSDVKTFQPDECSMFRLHTNTSVTVDTALEYLTIKCFL